MNRSPCKQPYMGPKSLHDLKRKVFVGGIAHHTTKLELKYYFSQFGAICSIDLPVYKKKRKIKGFAFVRFLDEESALRATQEVNQKLNGKNIAVRMSLDQETAAQKAKSKLKLKVFVKNLPKWATED